MINKNNSLISSLSITYISHFITIISQIILIKLLVIYLSQSDFGAYMVIKRFVSALWPILTIHLGLSMSRNIGMNTDNSNNYLISSTIIISVIFFVYLMIVLIFRSFFANILFGNKEYYYLIFPLSIYLYSNSLKSILSGYYRGNHEFVGMNLTRMLFWALQVLIIFVLYQFLHERHLLLRQFLLIFSLITLIIYICLIYKKVPAYIKLIKRKGIIKTIQSNSKLVKYGVYRLPNVLLMAAVFFIPVFYASNKLSLQQAGYIGCIITYIRLFQVAGEPFNQIILPVFSFNKSSRGMGLIKEHSKLIIEFIFTLPALLGLTGYLLSNEIIILWFGENYSSIINDVSMISPLIMFFFAFILIRGVLNGLFSYPYLNLISLYGVVAIIVGVLVTHFLSGGVEGLAISVGVGVFILGASSIYYLSSTLDLLVFSKNNIKSIVWALFILFLFWLFKNFVIIDNIYLMILLKVIFAVFIIILSFIVYIKMNYNWVDKLIQKYNLKKYLKRVPWLIQ